ncbi:MAG: hypothetical protein IAG13_38965, partial [Deltaproteobacteria bacterium]|nr:hypothetical protein [Nannocystaceae bacterium]
MNRCDRWRRPACAAVMAGLLLACRREGPPAALVDEQGADAEATDEIYAWPLGGRCRIDEQTVKQTYTEDTFPSTLITGRTMD